MKDINARGLVMIGCGFMGQAMLQGWLKQGMAPQAIYIEDPNPSDWVLRQHGIQVNAPWPKDPAVVVIAVKPQTLGQVLPKLTCFGGGRTLFLSIVTGVPFTSYAGALGPETPVARVMPNLPSAVGAGVGAYLCNAQVTAQQAATVERLLAAIGVVTPLDNEDQLHAVTGISGSGPAYVFALAEAMTQAGEAMGLPKRLASILAIQTIAGAGQMMSMADVSPADLRAAVTSKGGTTAQALNVLMAADTGLADLMNRTCSASRDRSIELGA